MHIGSVPLIQLGRSDMVNGPGVVIDPPPLPPDPGTAPTTTSHFWRFEDLGLQPDGFYDSVAARTNLFSTSDGLGVQVQIFDPGKVGKAAHFFVSPAGSHNYLSGGSGVDFLILLVQRGRLTHGLSSTL